jgi:hypothetical protein
MIWNNNNPICSDAYIFYDYLFVLFITWLFRLNAHTCSPFSTFCVRSFTCPTLAKGSSLPRILATGFWVLGTGYWLFSSLYGFTPTLKPKLTPSSPLSFFQGEGLGVRWTELLEKPGLTIVRHGDRAGVLASQVQSGLLYSQLPLLCPIFSR